MADYYIHLTIGIDSESRDGSSIQTAWLTVPYAFGRSAAGDTIKIYDIPTDTFIWSLSSPGPCVIASDGTATALEAGIVDTSLAFTAGDGILTGGTRYTLEAGIVDGSLVFSAGTGVLDSSGARTTDPCIYNSGTVTALEAGIVDSSLAFTAGDGILTGGMRVTLEAGIVDTSLVFSAGTGVLDSSGTRTSSPCIYESGNVYTHGLLSTTAYQASGVVDANGNAWALDATDSPPFLAGREAAAPGGQFGGGGFF